MRVCYFLTWFNIHINNHKDNTGSTDNNMVDNMDSTDNNNGGLIRAPAANPPKNPSGNPPKPNGLLPNPNGLLPNPNCLLSNS